jgi:hypothetical protein
MINCYEKSYGRDFIDSANEWRELERLTKEQNEQNREEQLMKIVNPQLVNQKSLLSNNEGLIE